MYARACPQTIWRVRSVVGVAWPVQVPCILLVSLCTCHAVHDGVYNSYHHGWWMVEYQCQYATTYLYFQVWVTPIPGALSLSYGHGREPWTGSLWSTWAMGQHVKLFRILHGGLMEPHRPAMCQKGCPPCSLPAMGESAVLSHYSPC